ncbi:hypothetical protein AS235_15865 [Enterococcus faecium]|nr:hypothetical protein AS235_15865 [Enterococcus faecium]
MADLGHLLDLANCEEAFGSIQANVTPAYQFQLFHQKYGLIQCQLCIGAITNNHYASHLTA